LGAAPKKKTEPEPLPLLPAIPAWSIQLEVPPSAGGAMDGDRVYVPVQGGQLEVFDRETGEALWTMSADVGSTPVARDGVVFIATPDAIRAVDGRTGLERWSTPIAKPIASPLVSHDGVLFAADDTGEALALRAEDGRILWRHALDATCRFRSVPSDAGAIVFSIDEGRVIALDVESGEPIWEQNLPGKLSAPAAAKNRVLVGSTNNFLYALDASNGRIKWRWRTGGDVVGAAADSEGGVYIASLDNVLRAVDRDNGNQRWKVAIATRPAVPPIAVGRIVVLTGVSPRVDALVAKEGTALGSYAAPADLEGPPLIDETMKPFRVAMVVLTRNGRLVGLRPEKMMLPDPQLAPLTELPGQRLDQEKRPTSPRSLTAGARADRG
jgi:outer membrane protein assembly factor BamB